MGDADRPAHWSKHNAAAFQLSDVVDNYHLRAPYPSTLAAFLRDLAVPPGGSVLELGCGTGEIARSLAEYAERIDAIDISAPMLDRARSMPGGDHPAIRWIEGRAEEAPFDGPYALAVAGASLHWMDWEVALPRVADHLAPGAFLAIVVAPEVAPPWAEELREVISRYSVMQSWEKVDLIALLEARRLLERIGEKKFEPEPYMRSVDEYIDAQHATSGLARARMGIAEATAFDNELRALLAAHAQVGMLNLAAAAEIEWGTLTRVRA